MHSHIYICVHKHKIGGESQTENKNAEQWPGRGPFNHLPPWQRPGHACGGRRYRRRQITNPQACARFPGLPRWWWTDPTYGRQPLATSPQDEIAALEEAKKELGKEKANMEQEINSIETQLTELKTKRESQKTTIKQ